MKKVAIRALLIESLKLAIQDAKENHNHALVRDLRTMLNRYYKTDAELLEVKNLVEGTVNNPSEQQTDGEQENQVPSPWEVWTGPDKKKVESNKVAKTFGKPTPQEDAVAKQELLLEIPFGEWLAKSPQQILDTFGNSNNLRKTMKLLGFAVSEDETTEEVLISFYKQVENALR